MAQECNDANAPTSIGALTLRRIDALTQLRWSGRAQDRTGAVTPRRYSITVQEREAVAMCVRRCGLAIWRPRNAIGFGVVIYVSD
jgi:hypothetical protein